MKSGNLNFLEPSGPLQACNGADLPLYRFFKISDSPFSVQYAKLMSSQYKLPDFLLFHTINQKMHNYFTNYHTPLHVSTLSCHPQGVCS